MSRYNDIIELSSRHSILQKFDTDTVWCHDTSISIPFDPALVTSMRITDMTPGLPGDSHCLDLLGEIRIKVEE